MSLGHGHLLPRRRWALPRPPAGHLLLHPRVRDEVRGADVARVERGEVGAQVLGAVLARVERAEAVQKRDGGAVPKTAFDTLSDEIVATRENLVEMMAAVQEVHVSEVFQKHTVEVVRRTRRHPSIELGGSPRAGLAMIQAARARAFIHGRDYVVPEDLYALAEDVLLHRMRLRYEALAEGISGVSVLKKILSEAG